MELKRSLRTAIAIAAFLLLTPAQAAYADPADARSEAGVLAQVFDESARRDIALDPVEQLYRGEPVEASTFRRLFTEDLDRERRAAARIALSAIARIERQQLSPDQQISHDVFLLETRARASALQPDVLDLTSVRPFNHFGGLPVEFPSLMASDGAVPYRTEADYRSALALNAAFADVIDNAILRFRRGVATGVVEPKLTVTLMIAQIDALLAVPPESSLFYGPVLNFPEGIAPSVQARLRPEFSAVIRDSIYPAYRRLRSFLADEYLPVARETVGLSGMKGGARLYRRLIESESTLRLDPEQIHRLGLGEVARIQRDMELVRARLGYEGSLRDFFAYIRTEPRFHPRTADELRQGFERIAREVSTQLPRFFRSVPRTPLMIRPYPSYRDRYEAGGSYSEGAEDGSRPGVFYYNTYDLPSRFLTGMATLYLHEGSPGHHLQISLAKENATLPAFQRSGGNNAYTEGWALYAETLGYDMGLYADPLQHWGTLDDEMLRAMRLVVDTGIHAKGWSRDQSIAYMLANSGMGRTDAAAEVDRYIANPAQALSYKIGALVIQRLRRRAETAFGKSFDIRDFHDQVLGSGALPLPVLEAKIDRWIADKRR